VRGQLASYVDGSCRVLVMGTGEEKGDKGDNSENDACGVQDLSVCSLAGLGPERLLIFSPRLMANTLRAFLHVPGAAHVCQHLVAHIASCARAQGMGL
jgi:hypothetical protein